MTSEPPKVSAPPEWEYLIAHHFPDRYGRTLEVRLGDRAVHFCARCSGELIGFVVFLACFIASHRFAVDLSTPIGGVVLGLCPTPAALDWLTQTVRSRESGNRLRLASGTLLGAALGGLVAFGWTHRWPEFAGGILVFVAYIATAMLVLYRTGAWRRVLAEHFP
jgi:uncharacterized membrane protein